SDLLVGPLVPLELEQPFGFHRATYRHQRLPRRRAARRPRTVTAAPTASRKAAARANAGCRTSTSQGLRWRSFFASMYGTYVTGRLRRSVGLLSWIRRPSTEGSM